MNKNQEENKVASSVDKAADSLTPQAESPDPEQPEQEATTPPRDKNVFWDMLSSVESMSKRVWERKKKFLRGFGDKKK